MAAGLGFAVCSLAVGAADAPRSHPFSVTGTFASKVGFDSNVRLQSYSEAAEQGSFVTSLQPALAANWSPSSEAKGSLGYAPEATFFHSDHEEDHSVHRVTGAWQETIRNTSIDLSSAFVAIDGSDLGPTWTGLGGAPAAGGPAVRDRRDALVFRSAAKVTARFDPWLVRPVVSGYVHDFQAKHRTTAGYQNYVDRNEWTAGIDLGRSVGSGLNAFAGYRFGAQDQSRLLQFPDEYDSEFHRVLFGLEGKLGSALRVNLSAGPESRHFSERTPASFGRKDRENLFADFSFTLTPSAADTLTLSLKKFEQPGFGGRSTYQDLTIDLGWKRALGKQFVLGASGRAYNTDFRAPTLREDWILSGSAFLNIALPKAWNAELSYLYEEGQSELADMAGREYSRHAVFIGIKRQFGILN